MIAEYSNKEDILLQKLAGGEQSAFQFIFNQHYRALCYFAFTIVDNEQEAEDLVQETFSKLWDKRATLNLPLISKPSFLLLPKMRASIF